MSAQVSLSYSLLEFLEGQLGHGNVLGSRFLHLRSDDGSIVARQVCCCWCSSRLFSAWEEVVVDYARGAMCLWIVVCLSWMGTLGLLHIDGSRVGAG